MVVTVIGGTGTVGAALVEHLRGVEAEVRVVSRDPSGVAGGVQADLDVPESLRAAVDGAEAVFLLVPNGPAETHRALTALSVILDAGVKRLVYLSSDLSRFAPLVPHAGAKLAVEAAIRASGISHTILHPTFFMQNDLMLRDALLAGFYPQPCGLRPLARVDTRDVAEAAARALLDGAAEGETVLISSPDSPNGAETAALWSEVLGREVIFPHETPEDWGRAMAGTMPPWMVFDLCLMFRHFQRAGHPVDPNELKAQTILLPNGSLSYREFARGCARDWGV